MIIIIITVIVLIIISTFLRGWRNTVEIVLLEISNSMKPHPSVLHAYTNSMGLVIVFLSQEISMRFPTAFRQPLSLTVAKCGVDRFGHRLETST